MLRHDQSIILLMSGSSARSAMKAQRAQVADWAGLGTAKESRVAPETTWVTVPLLKEEGKRYFQNKGVTTVTFFSGDAAGAEAQVRARLDEMLAANPWLAGSLTSKRALRHPPSGAGLVDRIFRTAAVEAVAQTAEFNSLTEACWPIGVPAGPELVRTGAPVTRVALLTGGGGLRPSDGFVLLFSVSHVVCDGTTYYQLLSMLSATGEVRALNPTRPDNAGYTAHERAAMGPAEYRWGNGLVFIKAMIAGLMKKTPIKGQLSGYLVDAAKVEEAKARAAAASPTGYVTTNDVLFSHFCNAVGARVAMQTFNLRERVGYAPTAAGNYEAIIPYDPQGYATPDAVRRSLVANSSGGHIGHVQPLPGFCAGASPCAFWTSWAQPFDLTFEGCEQSLHLPIMPMPGGFKNTPMDFAVPFWARPKQLAVFYVAVRASRDKLKGVGSPLGDAVSKELFPDC
jgi:hypothetical protein